ncbi:DUF2127 domain-containing protein [Diaphorobacter sp. HDW4A]|uniref:DUF2127 domain-containing protein n=1 Tax=Diaphorobacter sp. HDW4A TaxID=2714924 RepID=UPI00140DEABE|nr:DUF2127 domain-containing protein [Diaphorobacter sp. HDW4A]QIL80498.1 DUF2127 domain-containing protein [Diaphorobacter sp. HDW4A]
MNPHESRLRKAIQAVALFEAAKGLAALLGLLGLLTLLHHDMHRLAVELIGHFGLSPYAHHPEMLINAVDNLVGTPTHTIVLLGSAYIALRWVEAWGLWHDKAWGEWFGALSSGLYIPLEIRHIFIARHWQGVVVLLLNIALMLILFWRIADRRRTAAISEHVSQTLPADQPRHSKDR